ncbi:MAG: hypothetical protein NZ734_03625 [Paracoccus sp.]|nr:hypothetical protein [Paracoccus sp. (in: a-proteobacteria)]
MTKLNQTKTSRRGVVVGAAAAGMMAAVPARAAMDGTLYEVEIRNFSFIPKTLDVKVGDRIRWINRDRAPHDATALDSRWNTPILDQNQYTELTVTADMGGEYACSIHPPMRARLNVAA